MKGKSLLIHLSSCSHCSPSPCGARTPVVCAICGKYLHNGQSYSGYYVCDDIFDETEDVSAFRGDRADPGHVPVCQDCREIIESTTIEDYLTDEFKKALDDFKNRIKR